jgi:hypothetical protein
MQSRQNSHSFFKVLDAALAFRDTIRALAREKATPQAILQVRFFLRFCYLLF